MMEEREREREKKKDGELSQDEATPVSVFHRTPVVADAVDYFQLWIADIFSRYWINWENTHR